MSPTASYYPSSMSVVAVLVAGRGDRCTQGEPCQGAQDHVTVPVLDHVTVPVLDHVTVPVLDHA